MLNRPLTVYTVFAAISLTPDASEAIGSLMRSEAITYAVYDNVTTHREINPVIVRGANVSSKDEVWGDSVLDRPAPPVSASSARIASLSKAWCRLETFTEKSEFNPDRTPVSMPTVKVAMQIIRFMSDYPVPQLTASDEGEVVLTWYGPKARIEAFVDADLHFTSLGRFAKGFVDGDDIDWQGTSPRQLAELLKQAYK